MKVQQYENHVRYYLPHHVFFYLLILTLLGIGITGIIKHEASLIWIVVTALAFMIGWLSFMMRQHYALTVQNRVVRLELRFRYYLLTGKRLERVEEQLSFNQLAALRFTSDEEFEPLLDRAIKEQLSPDAIKKAIKSWQPDLMRV